MTELILIILITVLLTVMTLKRIERIKEQGRVQAYKEMMAREYGTRFVVGCTLRCNRCNKLCNECFRWFNDERQREEELAKQGGQDDTRGKNSHNQ